MKKIAIRGAAVAAAAGLAIGGLATGTANADTLLNLGTSSTTERIGDSTVTVTIKDHKALLSPGMVALPTTRNAWVSGSISAKFSGGKASGGSIAAGYVVGCQIDVGSAGVTAGVAAGTTDKDGNSYYLSGKDAGKETVGVSASAKTGASLKLAAGSIGTQYLTYDRATWPKPGDEISPSWADPSNSFKFSGSSGSLSFADQTIGVDGCAGYAQARFFAKVKATSGNNQGTVILWGKPFTLG